jgi:hypothetical protein
MAPTKKIRVTYNAWDEFVIPSSIDLDKVWRYHVKYNKLYIQLKENDSETLIIESKGFLENDDFKYPDNITDSDTDDSDYEFGDSSDEEEEEPLPKYKLPPPKIKSKPTNN